MQLPVVAMTSFISFPGFLFHWGAATLVDEKTAPSLLLSTSLSSHQRNNNETFPSDDDRYERLDTSPKRPAGHVTRSDTTSWPMTTRGEICKTVFGTCSEKWQVLYGLPSHLPTINFESTFHFREAPADCQVDYAVGCCFGRLLNITCGPFCCLSRQITSQDFYQSYILRLFILGPFPGFMGPAVRERGRGGYGLQSIRDFVMNPAAHHKSIGIFGYSDGSERSK